MPCRLRHSLPDDDSEMYHLSLLASLAYSYGDTYRPIKENLIIERYIKNLPDDKRQRLQAYFIDLTKVSNFDITEICRRIKNRTPYSDRYQFLDLFFAVAVVDGSYTRTENDLVKEVASNLGISNNDYVTLFHKHLRREQSSQQHTSSNTQQQRRTYTRTFPQPRSTNAYAILGLTPSATDEQVRRAYRQLAMQYHPDRVANQSEEVQRRASIQFRNITKAYEHIKKQRGMK